MAASEKSDQPQLNGQTNGSAQTDKQNDNAENQNGNTSNEDSKQQKKNPKKINSAKDKITGKKEKTKDKKNPPGGYDSTSIPSARDGYTVKFTFHRAQNLPVSDLAARSSDPYIHATLTSDMPKRHKEDPDMTFRAPTIHKNTDPEWNAEWIVAGIPSSGFMLKCRVYDEDSSDRDDRLGNVTVYVNHVDTEWLGIKNERYLIKKRMGVKRAYMLRGCVALVSRGKMGGELYLSAEVIGELETRKAGCIRPMIGRIAGTKAPEELENSKGGEKKAEKFDFQANQFQLQGPVPPELYHRFVEFKSFVAGMFQSMGIRGRVLNKALHHQHRRVYNFSSTTEHGDVPPKSEEATLQFLKMVHFDEGGRIFTYVLTLDGNLRFTETGKEFGIDLLSKHTMHSDVNLYIACSGEFFVRRLAHPEKSTDDPQQKSHPDDDVPGGPPNSKPPLDPKHYELIIDNDSGTYRPKGDLLSKLKEFLNANFPGLHVVVKECTDKELSKMKDAQLERKKKEGQHMAVVQGDRRHRGTRGGDDDDSGNISSSDEEELDRRVGGGEGQSKRQRAFEALEDPKAGVRGLRDLVPGQKGKGKEAEEATALS